MFSACWIYVGAVEPMKLRCSGCRRLCLASRREQIRRIAGAPATREMIRDRATYVAAAACDLWHIAADPREKPLLFIWEAGTPVGEVDVTASVVNIACSPNASPGRSLERSQKLGMKRRREGPGKKRPCWQ